MRNGARKTVKRGVCVPLCYTLRGKGKLKSEVLHCIHGSGSPVFVMPAWSKAKVKALAHDSKPFLGVKKTLFFLALFSSFLPSLYILVESK